MVSRSNVPDIVACNAQELLLHGLRDRDAGLIATAFECGASGDKKLPISYFAEDCYPLEYAVFYHIDDPVILAELVENTHKFRWTTMLAEPPLHWAITRENVNAVRAILDSGRYDLQEREPMFDQTPSALALQMNNIEIRRLVICATLGVTVAEFDRVFVTRSSSRPWWPLLTDQPFAESAQETASPVPDKSCVSSITDQTSLPVAEELNQSAESKAVDHQLIVRKAALTSSQSTAKSSQAYHLASRFGHETNAALSLCWSACLPEHKSECMMADYVSWAVHVDEFESIMCDHMLNSGQFVFLNLRGQPRPKDALKRVIDFLQFVRSAPFNLRFAIITGRGRQSKDGEAKIRKEVVNYLQMLSNDDRMTWSFWPADFGCIDGTWRGSSFFIDEDPSRMTFSELLNKLKRRFLNSKSNTSTPQA